MADGSTIANFYQTWSPYAIQAGKTLNVDPQIILKQWALESAHGTSNAAKGYNLAGLSPGGKLATFQSPQDFANYYTNTIQNNFPAATNAGSDPNKFNAGLVNGRIGRYYTADANTYGAALGAKFDPSLPAGPVTGGGGQSGQGSSAPGTQVKPMTTDDLTSIFQAHLAGLQQQNQNLQLQQNMIGQQQQRLALQAGSPEATFGSKVASALSGIS